MVELVERRSKKTVGSAGGGSGGAGGGAGEGSSMATDWGEIRGEFPSLAQWTYLNTATFGQMPRRAAEAVARHFARRDERACTDFMRLVRRCRRHSRAHRRVHPLPAAGHRVHPECVGGTVAVAGRPGLEDGRPDRHAAKTNFRIITTIPRTCAARGVEFVETAWDGFYASLTPRTRLVAISTVNYSTGFRPPLEEISAGTAAARDPALSGWHAKPGGIAVRCVAHAGRICSPWTLISGCSRPMARDSCMSVRSCGSGWRPR